MTKQMKLIFSYKNIEDPTVFYAASNIVSILDVANKENTETNYVVIGMNSFAEEEKLVVDLLLNFQKQKDERVMLKFLHKILNEERKKNKLIEIKVL